MSNISVKSKSEAKNVWQILYTLGGVGAAVDSAFVVGSTLFAYFMATLQNEFLSWGFMGTIVACYLVIVDWALFKFLPSTLDGILSKKTQMTDALKNKRIQQFYAGTLLFCVLQTAATITVTLYLREDAAHISAEKPKLGDPAAIATASAEDLRRSIESIDNDIAQLKNERAQAKRNAEYSNKELVNLRAVGNGWAAGEINKKVSKAGTKYDEMIREKENTKNNLINTSSTTLQTTVASISKVNDFKIQDFKINVGAISNLLMFFGIGGTIVQWYAAFMLALMLSGLNIGNRNNNFLGIETNDIDPQTAAPQMVNNRYPHDRHLQAAILNNQFNTTPIRTYNEKTAYLCINSSYGQSKIEGFEMALIVDNKAIFSCIFNRDNEGWFFPHGEMKTGFKANEDFILKPCDNSENFIGCVKSIMARLKINDAIEYLERITITEILPYKPPTPVSEQLDFLSNDEIDILNQMPNDELSKIEFPFKRKYNDLTDIQKEYVLNHLEKTFKCDKSIIDEGYEKINPLLGFVTQDNDLGLKFSYMADRSPTVLNDIIELNKRAKSKYETLVSQVTQQNTGQLVTRETLTKWRGDCSTYYTRSKTQKTPEARRNSDNHYQKLRGYIESLGIEVIEDGNVLDFKNYTTVRNTLPVANNKGVENV